MDKIKELTSKELFQLLVRETRTLKLNEEKKKSRTTFSNAHRVVAYELRKHFVLVHLPKRENFKDLITTLKKNDKDVDHIEPFDLSYDSRTWTYLRVSRQEELEPALKVVSYAKDHNSI